MSAFLDERYSDWLYDQVFPSRVKNPMQNYRGLAHILFTKEFVWLVPNDDNRVEDGKALRYEFLDDEELAVPREEDYWLDLGCSVLEVLVGLARRLEFLSGKDTHYWFVEMIGNLGLKEYHDAAPDIPEHEIIQILDDLIWRQYSHTGRGGLFPLRHPERDQREVEIWYQLNAYLLERSYV